MHAARPDRSPRLQRVLAVLDDGAEHSTLDIIRAADVCAVNSIVAELRWHGAEIGCRCVTVDGERRWLYRLVRPPRYSLAERRSAPPDRAISSHGP